MFLKYDINIFYSFNIHLIIKILEDSIGKLPLFVSLQNLITETFVNEENLKGQLNIHHLKRMITPGKQIC